MRIIKPLLPLNIFLFVITTKFFSRILPSKLYLKLLFYFRFKKHLNLKSPQTFNEKLQWLKLYDKNPEYQIDVDKYLVRKKISELIGDQYLIPLLGVYNNPNEIDLSKLPAKFVLKCNHGTHCSLICKDKESFNFIESKRQLSKWMRHNYFYDAREWPYKNIRRVIVCEQYISDINDELIDYKFLCFNGIVKLILVHQDINNVAGKHTLDIYTPDWEKTNIEWGIPRSNSIIERPKCLNECIKLCEILSKNRKHVRIDLYIVDNKIYFGEMTYYSAAGFKPFSDLNDDITIGNWINLNEK